MNRQLISVICITTVLFAIYWLGFYLLPAITTANNSGVSITHAEIASPSNHLDFGEIDHEARNTLHYSL